MIRPVASDSSGNDEQLGTDRIDGGFLSLEKYLSSQGSSQGQTESSSISDGRDENARVTSHEDGMPRDSRMKIDFLMAPASMKKEEKSTPLGKKNDDEIVKMEPVTPPRLTLDSDVLNTCTGLLMLSESVPCSSNTSEVSSFPTEDFVNDEPNCKSEEDQVVVRRAVRIAPAPAPNPAPIPAVPVVDSTLSADVQSGSTSETTPEIVRRRNVKRNMTRPTPFRCELCLAYFKERGNLTKHMKSIHSNAPKQFPCLRKGCSATFSFRDGQRRHEITVHLGVRAHKCQYPGCKQAFKQRSHAQKHQKTVHKWA